MEFTNTQDLTKIANIMKKSIQKELAEKKYPSRGYAGETKPVKSLKYPTVVSNRRNTSFLYKSVDVYYQETPEGNLQMVIDFGPAYYWRWVDEGRKGAKQGAKYPPLETILTWATQRNIPQFRDERGRFLSNLQRAYMLRSSIGAYGIYPTNFIQNGINAVIDQVTNELGDWAAEFLTTLMEEKNIIYKSLQLVK